MAVPYTFGNATTSIPLSQLDTNFATAITIGNTAVYLGNTTTSFGNVTLTNVTISSGNATVTTLTAPTHNSASSLTFQTNGTTPAMTIDTSQNVGIGTTSPSARLDVQNTTQRTALTGTSFGVLNLKSTTNTGDYAALTFQSSAGVPGAIMAYQQTASGGQIAFGVSNNFGSGITAEAMRIDSSGNVGIGTSSPAAKLDVSGGGSFTGNIEAIAPTRQGVFFGADAGNTNNRGVDICVGASSLAWLDFTATGSDYKGRILYDNAANTMDFFTNGTYRARIDSNGNFLINTTNTTLYSATSGYGVCYRRNASLDVLVTSDNAVILNRTGTDGSIEEFRKSGTIVGSISVTTTATAYNTSSDYRLKENVQQMVGGLATVSALKPVRYDWISDKSAGEGFIAHELAEVIPLAVTGEKNAVYEDGSIKPQGVDYSKIVVHLVAAIQELKAELDALKGTK